MKPKITTTWWAAAVIAFLVVSLTSLYSIRLAMAGCPEDCEQVSCDCHQCTWKNQAWPMENICEDREERIAKECISGGTGGCSETFDNENPLLCCKVWWTYIGGTGGSELCVDGEAKCQQHQEFMYDTGRQIPNTCTDY